MKTLFWICAFGSAYAYFGYPLALMCVSFLFRSKKQMPGYANGAKLPSVTILIPVHNEANVVQKKVENTLLLDYPARLEALVISDGSTDNTVELLKSLNAEDRLRILELRERKGKAHALNAGLKAVTGEILVFSDASIMLDRQSIREIVQPFADPRIGCASGEDYIEGGGGEGLYGKYELYLRQLESRIGSIAGASGSFYAQRRELMDDFVEGLAPDFLSVLSTVEKGYRVVSVPSAFGHMTALSSTTDEFHRKVRTIVRGMTALFSRKRLLNPFRYPAFAFTLWSHKVMRWCVPIFLIGLLICNVPLADTPFYAFTLGAQIVFYALAALAYFDVGLVASNIVGRIALYFVAVNIAILKAWVLYFSGVRQELWTPSKRASNDNGQ
jgi:cellulose synthase/poly-beta-1,6-N-acetylglucosamine synthase-like glycosyltransferase